MRLIEELTQSIGVLNLKQFTPQGVDKVSKKAGALLLCLLTLSTQKPLLAKDISPEDLINAPYTEGDKIIRKSSPFHVSPKSRNRAGDKPNSDTYNYETSALMTTLSEIKSDLNSVSSNPLTDEIIELCNRHSHVIEEVAKRENFPKVLIMAFFAKENSCEMRNKNPDGVFHLQTQRKKYPVGKINETALKEQISDFINFCRKKVMEYEANGGKSLNISYKEFSLIDVKFLATIYSGMPKGVTPDNSHYVYGPRKKRTAKKEDDGYIKSQPSFLAFLKGVIETNIN